MSLICGIHRRTEVHFRCIIHLDRMATDSDECCSLGMSPTARWVVIILLASWGVLLNEQKTVNPINFSCPLKADSRSRRPSHFSLQHGHRHVTVTSIRSTLNLAKPALNSWLKGFMYTVMKDAVRRVAFKVKVDSAAFQTRAPFESG